MAWTPLQLSDVQTRLSAGEIAVIQANATAGTDPVGATLARVTNLVRGYVANQTELGPEGTLPDKLFDCALDIFVVRYLSLVNAGKAMITPARTEALKDANALLKLVAIGTFRIEVPTAPAVEQPLPQSPSPSISRGPRQIGRRRGVGLYEEGA